MKKLSSGRSLRTIISLFTSLTLLAAFSAESAETLVPRGSVWKYLDDGSDQGTAWRAPGYNDSTWASGPAQLGFGDGDEVTVVSFGSDPSMRNITTYFRGSFYADPTDVSNLTLHLLRDDGAVVYLNGVEVFRSNMPAGPIAFNTLATAAVGGAEETTQFVEANISPSNLVAGLNVIAVEVHQVAAASSDLSFDLELEADASTSTNNIPPAVTLLVPAERMIFMGPTNIFMRARATDVDGTIARVEFFAGSNHVGTSGPFVGGTNIFFSTIWTNAPATGVHVLTARAIDNVGAVTVSAPVTIAVVPYPVPPLVVAQVIDSEGAEAGSDPAVFRVTRSPVRNTPLTVYYSIDGSAQNGSDYELIGGSIDSAVIPAGVAFADITFRPIDDEAWEGTEVIWFQLLPTAPGTIPVFPPPEDGYRVSTNNARLTAAIVDNETNRPPTVQIVSPLSGATFPAGSHITIVADVSDPDGGVTDVYFFANNNLLGQVRTANSPPDDYSLTWSNVAVGEYVLTVRAAEASGNFGQSQPVPIRVVADGQGTNVVLVAGGGVWKYFAAGSEPAGAWREAAYDDSFWPSGRAQLGYGDGDETTVVPFGPDPSNKYITTYFRHLFQVTDPTNVTSLTLRLLEDDGAVVYLNGVEVLRDNLPAGPAGYATLAIMAVEDRTVEVQLSPSLLVSGVNVLAVEMHQVTATSSDLSFDLQLAGTRPPGEPELPRVNVVATDPYASEGSITTGLDAGRFTFTRTGSLSNELTVSFTLGGTAINGTDYIFVTNQVRFGPGVAGTTVSVNPRVDDLPEPTETVVVTLEDPVCAAIVPPPPGCYRVGPSNQATVFIANNTPTNVLPVVTVQTVDGTASEIPPNVDMDPNPALFRISRTGPTNHALSIGYRMSGTASNGVDYERLSGTAELAVGARFTDVRIDVISDNLVEGTETVVLTLNPPACVTIDPPPPGCYRIGLSNSATARILDTPFDTNLPPTVALVSPPDGAVFQGPTNVLLVANANDPNGYMTVVYVEFFEGTRSLGVRTNFPTANPLGPFVLPWQNVQPGQYTLTAVATDDHGAKGTSAPVRITVLSAPVDMRLISMGSHWAYMDQGIDLGTAWREQGFNGSFWPLGPAQLGYGDGDEATVVSYGPDAMNKYITTYFRRSFPLTNTMRISGLRGRLLQDDGAAVYLNGVEVFRSNLPAGTITFDTLASSVSPDNQIVDFTAPANLLVHGINVVAVEMHQVNPTSSDLSFDLELIAETGDTNEPPALPIVTVVASDPDAAESGPLTVVYPGTFTFHRTGDLNGGLTAFLAVSGTAANGVDYIRVTNAVRFAPGSAEADLDIYPISDNHIEPTETVVLTLQTPACAAIVPPPPGCYRVGTARQATVFIRDANTGDPTNAPPQVRITAPTEGAVFCAPAEVRIEAVTTDRDGYANTVEFFANEVKIGEARVEFIQPPAPGTPIHFEFIWRGAPLGQHRLTARTVDNRGGRAVSAPVNITVQEQPPTGDRELHVVGIYSGTATNGGVSHNNQPGRTAVHVDRPGKLVTLFLSAYEPVNWSITISSGTVIEKVYVAGYYPPTVGGVGASVPVVRLGYEYYIGYTLESGHFYRVAPKVRALTGMEFASFHGDYQGPYPTPFVIDEVQNDPRLHSSYPVPTPLSELPDLRFSISFSSGSGVYSRAYTLGGPVDGGKLLSGDHRAVSDNTGRYYYALAGNGLIQINPSDGTTRSLPVSSNLPELSWPMGVAYDSKRDRVLLVSLGGEGFLYGYSAAQDTWSVVSSMNNLDLASLVYHPGEDALYGMGVAHYDGGDMTLYRLNPDGTEARQMRLPLYPWGVHMNSSELVSVGEHLVLLLRPSLFGFGNSDEESRMYLIKPATGDVWLTYRDLPETDRDHDGVPDHQDRCPNTPPGTVVDASGCPPNVADADGDGVRDTLDRCPNTASGSVVNAQGCSLGQLCPCNGPWRSNGDYVSCVIDHAWEFFRAGLITADQRRAAIRDAVASNCGRDPARVEAPRLHRLPLSHQECLANGLQFVVSGEIGINYVIEGSTDLIHWTVLEVRASSNIGDEIACLMDNSVSARFYRVRADH